MKLPEYTHRGDTTLNLKRIKDNCTCDGFLFSWWPFWFLILGYRSGVLRPQFSEHRSRTENNKDTLMFCKNSKGHSIPKITPDDRQLKIGTSYHKVKTRRPVVMIKDTLCTTLFTGSLQQMHSYLIISCTFLLRRK